MFRAASLAALVLSVLLWSDVAAAAGRLRAFLIGVESYTHLKDLHTPNEDIRRIEAELRKRSFEDLRVIVDDPAAADAQATSYKSIRKTWTDFLDRIQSGDVVVVYFAGHGMERNGKNYLLVSDTPNSAAVDGSVALDVQQMIDEVTGQKDRRPGLTFLILDACRDDPFPSSTAQGVLTASSTSTAPSTASTETPIEVSSTAVTGKTQTGAPASTRAVGRPPGIVPPSRPPKNVFIMYSAGIGQTALDDSENAKNSLFADELGKLLEEDSKGQLEKTSLAEIAQKIRYAVYQKAWTTKKHVQTPAYYDQLERALSLMGEPAGERILKPPAKDEWLKFTASDLKKGDIIIECIGCPELVVLEEDDDGFMMGSDSDASEATEQPRVNVRVTRRIAIGRFEVTQAEWRLFLASCKVSKHGCPADDAHSPPQDTGDRLPIANVSREDATKYVEWLSQTASEMTSRKVTYRLPTEAEWEYAARAGLDDDYSFEVETGETYADKLCQYANGADQSTAALGWVNFRCDDKFSREAAPVSSFRPNGFGLFDVHGNVWEWVADPWHDTHDGRPDTERVFDGGNTVFGVARGGSWRSGPGSLRSASRQAFPIDTRRATLGFRVVRELE